MDVIIYVATVLFSVLPREGLCGSPFCLLAQEARYINIKATKKVSLGGGSQKLERKELGP